MSEVAVADAQAVHRALDGHSERVWISVSRETAEFIARLMDARAQGQQIVVTRGHAEVTPNEAADLLGMSRPQVRRLMDQGSLTFRKVGAHHRIPVASIRQFLDAERPRRRVALEDLAAVQNDLGLTE